MSEPVQYPQPYTVRGWCPSGTRPMQTGDGLLVRVCPRRRSISTDHLGAIADVARRYGNGLIDLTRRANLQIRGVTETSLPLVWQELARLGLLNDDQPHILTGPLAGVDPLEIVDPGRLADELESAVGRVPALRELPAKFWFVVDGGGALPLDDTSADIRLRAVDVRGRGMVAVSVDGRQGQRSFAACEPHKAVAAALNLTECFLASDHQRARMRDLPDAAFASLGLERREHQFAPSPTQRPLGPIHIAGRIVAFALAAPFGRVTAHDLLGLVDQARQAGVTSFRVSPWRSLFALTADEAAATALSAAASGLSLTTDPDDPLLAIDACPGTPACSSASVDTRAVARALTPNLKSLGVKSCHVSGCAKGCARSAPADLTLVGAGGRLAIVHNGTARCRPDSVIDPGDLAALPHLLHRPKEAAT